MQNLEDTGEQSDKEDEGHGGSGEDGEADGGESRGGGEDEGEGEGGDAPVDLLDFGAIDDGLPILQLTREVQTGRAYQYAGGGVGIRRSRHSSETNAMSTRTSLAS